MQLHTHAHAESMHENEQWQEISKWWEDSHQQANEQVTNDVKTRTQKFDFELMTNVENRITINEMCRRQKAKMVHDNKNNGNGGTAKQQTMDSFAKLPSDQADFALAEALPCLECVSIVEKSKVC